MVRRTWQGDRRRDGDARGGRHVSRGPPPIRACAGSRRTRSASRWRSKTFPSRSPRSRCRDRPRAACSTAVADADIRSLKYFRMTRGAIAGVPVEISRTGYTGDLGYEIWMRVGSRDRRLGRADDRRPGVRHPSRRHAGARRRPRRGGPAADRRRLQRQQEGADRSRRSTHRSRWDSDASCSWTRGRSSAAGRCSTSSGARHATRQIVGLEISWPAVEKLYDEVGLRAAAVRRRHRASAVPVYRNGRQVGRATTTTWSPVLKKLIALATVVGAAFRRGHAARGRDHRRSSAPPRPGDGRQDAVLQPGAENRDAIG